MPPERLPTQEEKIAELEQENDQLREEVERLTKERDERERDAIMDELTKVLNRRGLNEVAQAILPRSKGAERELSKDKGRQVVAMFDLDNFKNLNSNYGHIKADEVLKRAAQTLRGFVRESDVVGRFGGEEFVVIFTNASGDNIKARLFDENNGGWKMSFTTRIDGEDIHSSFSSGITEVRDDETAKDFQTILERANQAMRRSKESGKNRVSSFEEDVEKNPEKEPVA